MVEDERLRVNLNPAPISSLGAFIDTDGCARDGTKDVYFIRYIGYEVETKYIDSIRQMDCGGNQRQHAEKGAYFRTEKLGSQIDPAEVNRYGAEYEQRCGQHEKQGAELRFQFEDGVGKRTMQEAYLTVLELYRTSSSGISQSMCRNFGIKLLFWAETYLPRLFSSSYCVNHSPKFVLSGNAKLQEYLFLYFLACMGCDVLYLNPDSDLSLSEELLALSYGYREMNCGSVAIPPYEGENYGQKEFPSVWEDKETVQSLHRPAAEGNRPHNAGQPLQNTDSYPPLQSEVNGSVQLDRNRLIRPSTGKRSAREAVSSTAFQQATPPSTLPVPPIAAASVTVGRTGILDTNRSPRRQLEYEELAKLSSAVVMISCHDDKGERFKTGSGVVISEKGYILTNFHVACGTAYYGIRFEEEEQIYQTNELIKYNQFYDLAVIKIEKKCSPLRLYREKKELVRGQKVVAIGSPLGLFNSFSDGIIAGFRILDDVSMIQFTAPISHGSSGGALLNLYGELIGINTAGFDDGQNINLAVDYKTVLAFAPGFL